jgi:hypothetical protein
MKKIFVFLQASLLLVGFVTITGAEAATKVISFGKGKSEATVSGKIKGHDSMDYLVPARAGQTLVVDFKASKGAAYFNVMLPTSTGEAFFVGSMSGNHYQGELPSDGDYIIRVYLMGAAEASGKAVSYKLKVGIPAGGKNSGAALGSGTGVAEKACLAAVAQKTGVDSSKLKITDVMAAEAGIGVSISVPDATAPWSCLSDKNGKVQGASFTGSEGKL